ncbi:hypothetical protein CON36_33050 [Bacillus cereus]|uniref:Uncharacterized protein n=1 Tax=Bacillus cereus TaxID=1396 RepID=A0A9X6SSY7_BACCE|nr:hypothetical protein CON36_33050 [Bacillus cereus]
MVNKTNVTTVKFERLKQPLFSLTKMKNMVFFNKNKEVYGVGELAELYAGMWQMYNEESANVEEFIKEKLHESVLGKGLANKVVNLFGERGSGKINIVQKFAQENNLSYAIVYEPKEQTESDIVIVDAEKVNLKEFLAFIFMNLKKLIVFSTINPVEGVENIEVKYDGYAGYNII